MRSRVQPGSCAASPLARVVLPLPQRPSSASTSGRVGFCASAALSSADRVDAVMGVGMGVNLLGRVRPKGQTREYPHYTTTATGRVERVWFVINNFFVIKA